MVIIIMINAVILVSRRKTVNAIPETARLTDLQRNVDAHGVCANKDDRIIANGEVPKTIIITITIIMDLLPPPITIIIIIIIITPAALRARVPRARVLRAEALRAGKAKRAMRTTAAKIKKKEEKF